MCVSRRLLHFAAILALSLIGALPLPAANEDTPRQRVLRVSAAIDSYPYSFLDESGQLTGYAVDLLDAVAEIISVEIIRIPVPAADAPAFSDGDYDLGQFHTPSPGRNRGEIFSQPVLVNRGEIFVRKNSRRLRSLEELRNSGVRIATPEGGEDYLVANGFDRRLIQRGTSAQCLNALSKGEVDAVVLTRLTGLGQLHYLRIENVEAVGANLPGLRAAYSFAARAKDAALISEINEALATLSVTGRMQEIYLKWFGRFEPKAVTSFQIALIAAASLGLALIVALWALYRQRMLREQIAGQAEELSQNQKILAAAQHFAHLGHWERKLHPKPLHTWSAETYRIFERDPSLPALTSDEILQFAQPADRERWREAIDLSNREARPYDLDLTVELRSGVRKILHVNARPVFDAAGRQTGVFGTVQDITAPRAAEVALRRSEQLLRALYANLPFGLGVAEQISDDWQVVSVNPAAFQHLGLDGETPASGPLRQSALAPQWQDYWRKLLAECASANQLVTRELVRPDLRRVFITSAIPLEATDSRARVCFLIEDVTERRRQESELAQGRRLRAIGELVGGIAHEFNNLLTPIRLGTELLQADWKHHVELSAQLKLIAGAADRSSQLVQRLLTFGRQSESRSELFELKAIIDANIELLRPTIDRRIAIDAVIPAHLPKLFLPTGSVHQIVVNLLLNARDTLLEKLTTPPAGWTPRVVIEAALLPPAAVTASGTSLPPAVSAWIRLTIRDTGRGMPPEVMERLFEPFYTTKQVGRGTGLGLATVWHLATGFGGRIEVESLPGAGSSFHVLLPVASAPKASVNTSTIATSQPASTQRRNLLLVDDEQAIAELVARLLRRNGHQITAVTQATEAWAMISAAPDAYDGIIIDLNMPGINGVEFARRARALPFNRPIFVVSGRVTDPERRALAAVNVTSILTKPFSADEFATALAAAFQRGAHAS